MELGGTIARQFGQRRSGLKAGHQTTRHARHDETRIAPGASKHAMWLSALHTALRRPCSSNGDYAKRAPRRRSGGRMYDFHQISSRCAHAAISRIAAWYRATRVLKFAAMDETSGLLKLLLAYG
jgi:hypothetical protein